MPDENRLLYVYIYLFIYIYKHTKPVTLQFCCYGPHKKNEIQIPSRILTRYRCVANIPLVRQQHNRLFLRLGNKKNKE